MIPKFDEYIKEALWKGVIDRSKSNELRKEDSNKLTQWLKDAKYNEIDFGLTSGNLWLSVNYGEMEGNQFGSGLFLTIDEVKEIHELLPPKYKIASEWDLRELITHFGFHLSSYSNKYKTSCYYYTNYKEKLRFPLVGTYWGETFSQPSNVCLFTYDESYEKVKNVILGKDKNIDIRLMDDNSKMRLPIRLIKEK
jgi:hypothetical protein